MSSLFPAVAAVLAFIIAVGSSVDPSFADDRTDRAVSIIVGDGEFNRVMPEYPTDPATERMQHTISLQSIEALLRSCDGSHMPADLRAERMKNLDRLREYWMRGEYPVNYEHPNAWEPVFIDREGAICAVGYLVEQSIGREAAERIAERYRYAAVQQIDAPELAHWIAGSGLTRAEVVTIQRPSIRPDGRWESGMNTRISDLKDLRPINSIARASADTVRSSEPVTLGSLIRASAAAPIDSATVVAATASAATLSPTMR